jgi:serine/threonine protein kinase
VRDKTTGSLYAMKVVNKSNAEKENKVRQMIVEKKIIEQFNHPFVVSLHSAFQTVISLIRKISFTL